MTAADEPNIIRHRAEKPEPFASVAPWAEKEEPRNLTRAAVVRRNRKAESDNVRNLRIELCLKTTNLQVESEICECATWIIPCGVLSIRIFYKALGRASRKI